MKISVKRTGGFAGIEEPIGTVDTADLSRVRATRMQESVQALQELFERGDQPVGADLMRYEIDVDDRHLVIVEDPENARWRAMEELLEELGQIETE